MRIALNVFVSIVVLLVCLWLVWPTHEQQTHLRQALISLTRNEIGLSVVGYFALLATTHAFRAWRWNYLLNSIGAAIPPTRLFAVSSVGFMAILVLPARLGELVRPALIRQQGQISASTALGTIIVERVIDGLLLSLFLSAAFFFHRNHEHAQPWMMPTAYLAFAVFATATAFLLAAIRWPQATVRITIGITGIRFFWPKLAKSLEVKLTDIIQGILTLKDFKNIATFLLWTITYWGANGASLWILARAFELPLSLMGAFTTMTLIAVGITIPNAPALVGQFQLFAIMGLSLYMPTALAHGPGLAFAIVLHAAQVVWYVGWGIVALASPYASMKEFRFALGKNSVSP